jgi:Family of unknown function (DUF6544)
MGWLEHHFRSDLHDLPEPLGEVDKRTVTEVELLRLPDAARSYLRFMGVVGHPRDWSFRARFTGRFRRAPGTRWMPCNAWQYNTNLPAPTRIFDMRVALGGVVPMFGRDLYEGGHGQMRGKLLDLVSVADSSGAEFDASELVTYLNDALMVAPSMLLNPNVAWTPVGRRSFDVSLTDAGRTVTGRVYLRNDGQLADFSTTDRWCALSDGLVRAPWSTPVDGWTVVRGRPFPTMAAAIWDLPSGPFRYAEGHFDPETVAFNVVPTGYSMMPHRASEERQTP